MSRYKNWTESELESGQGSTENFERAWESLENYCSRPLKTTSTCLCSRWTYGINVKILGDFQKTWPLTLRWRSTGLKLVWDFSGSTYGMSLKIPGDFLSYPIIRFSENLAPVLEVRDHWDLNYRINKLGCLRLLACVWRQYPISLWWLTEKKHKKVWLLRSKT